MKHFCPTVPILLIGLKKDLRHDSEEIQRLMQKSKQSPVSYEEGRLMSDKIGAAGYFECSARTKVRVKSIIGFLKKQRVTNPRNDLDLQ